MSINDYIKETRGELKHVSWPTQKQAIVYTITVIIIALAVGAYLGFFDYLFSNILKNFIL
jgi:preprotein translocase SecE subunit